MPVLLPDPPLLLVTDSRQASRPLETIVERALEAGSRWVSLREKHLPPDGQIALAYALAPMIRAHRATLTLHGADAWLAQRAGCDGLHLPAGADCAAARATLGADKLIGISIHTVAEAQAIDPALVDYAVAGPAFETPSKPGYGARSGPESLSAVIRAARVPVLAIGGITPARVGKVVDAGAAGVAVMGGVMRAADPGREVARLIATLADALARRARDRC